MHTPPVAILLGREHLYSDLLVRYLRHVAPELTLIEAQSVQQIEPEKLPPETVVLIPNISYGEGEFLDVIETVSRMLLDTPIAVISNFCTKQLRQLLQLNVRGYVSTNMPAGALVHALRLLLAGGEFMSAMVINELAAETREPGDKQCNQHAILSSLTKTEREVLYHLHQGKPNKLIGAELNLEETAIKAHLRNLTRRFGVRSRLELVVTTMGIREGNTMGIRERKMLAPERPVRVENPGEL
jgi:two-component system, NarL family, nitrate/nitrite response regulator NarL